MGWANCGTDSAGRPIGYAHEGTCDHPECAEVISRGVAHACGGMHGDQGGAACESYYCGAHLYFVDPIEGSNAETELQGPVCAQCASFLAFSDQIEEAELYRADPKFQPNDATRHALDLEGFPIDASTPCTE